MSIVGQKRFVYKINQKYLWHYRLGHIGEDRINRLEKDGILGSLNLESYLACKSCLQEKMVKLPFVGYEKRPLSYLSWYTLTYKDHLMCRSGVVTTTSLPLSMICLGMDMCI